MASLLQRSISSAAVQLDLATFLGVKCCAALVASQRRALSPQRSVPAAARRSLLAPFTSAQRGLPLAGCDALDSIIPPTRLEVLFLMKKKTDRWQEGLLRAERSMLFPKN
jgi:hypothetical protein